MSNIFNLFGTLDNASLVHPSKRETLGTMNNLMRSKTSSICSGNMAVKNTMINNGSKPKGLSLRPQSDPNICHTNSNPAIDKNTLLKIPLKSADCNLNTISNSSRSNKGKVSKAIRIKQKKGLSPVSKSPHSKVFAPKQEEFKFKKPATPRQDKKHLISYPEPEVLSGYCDQLNLDRISMEKLYLDGDYNGIISRKCVTPFEDEGFVSDPELLNIPSLLPLKISDVDSNNFDVVEMAVPELPSPSDDDDDF